MLRYPRHEIPAVLTSAKQQAVERILAAPRKAPRRVIHTVSTHPQHNLVGVGIGPKMVKGKPTSRPSVRLYVIRKLDKGLISRENILPTHIDGVETDVIETGRFRAQAPGPAARKRRRPAQPGCSVGFQLPAPHDDLIMAGTLGALVARGATHFILSNNHVLANENSLPIGSAIYQPGLLDHGNPATDAIARLSQFVPLSAGTPNRVDCAIAELTDIDLGRARVMSKVGKLSGDQPLDAVQGARVEKVGRGTGYTTGAVFDVSATVTLDYELGELQFVDQVLIRGDSGEFSAYGDSGAIVVDVKSRRAIGLLIGGTTEYSVVNHLGDVLTELGVSLMI
jgi:hypothetical protein